MGIAAGAELAIVKIGAWSELGMSEAATTWSVRHLRRVSDQATSDVVPDTARSVRRQWLACLTPNQTGPSHC